VEFVVDFFQRIWNLGFEALGQFGDWILLGATLVIPVWFIMRLMDRSNR
jgi:hypothetical protein